MVVMVGPPGRHGPRGGWSAAAADQGKFKWTIRCAATGWTCVDRHV